MRTCPGQQSIPRQAKINLRQTSSKHPDQETTNADKNHTVNK